MSHKKYIVKLTAEERQTLTAMISKGRISAKKMIRAQIILKADASPDGPNWTDAQVCAAFGVSPTTCQRVRQQVVETGLEATLTHKLTGRPKGRKLDGRAEALLIATACSPPPKGHARWTLRLLGTHLVALECVASISPETVRQVLKKTS